MAGGSTWEDETLAEWDSGKNITLFLFKKIRIKFRIFR